MEKILLNPMTRIGMLLLIIVCLMVSCDDLQNNQEPTTNINPTVQNEENNKGNVANDDSNKGEVRNERNQEAPNAAETFSERDLRYKGDKIKVTHHARCRMDCREIEAFEIQEIVDKKIINRRKSDYNPPAGKCVSIAYEGRTKRDNQRIRVVLGECENNPIIITVIDLEKKYQCSCK